jgi:DNA-binding NarL/FixJ family response regulator
MIRLLLTDSHASACEVLRVTLSAAAGLEIVGAATSSEELLEQLPTVGATLLLFDLTLPGAADAFALLPILHERHPQLRILACSGLTNEQYIARAFDLGAHGYILKSSSPTELVHALRTVAASRPFLCSAIGLALLDRLHSTTPADADAARTALGLSKREMEVLHLVAEGYTNTEIAARLFTSKRTVETHRQNIMEKTQTRNTASLIKMAVRQGLLPE